MMQHVVMISVRLNDMLVCYHSVTSDSCLFRRISIAVVLYSSLYSLVRACDQRARVAQVLRQSRRNLKVDFYYFFCKFGALRLRDCLQIVLRSVECRAPGFSYYFT